MLADRRNTVIFLALAALFYGVAVLPSVFFRHDDWWILGNSVAHLPHDWAYLWKPSLYYADHEIAWFFRPGFKLLVWIFYSVFGLQYSLWILSLLAGFLVSVWLGFLTVARISGETRNGFWFVVAMLCSLTLHFGSVAWVGEGLMNVPQALFLISSLFTFVCSWPVASWVFFALALCFKESSLFHCAFLGAIVVAEPYFNRRPTPQRMRSLAPFAVIALGYLFVRLGRMPYNPSYIPTYTWERLLQSGVAVLGPVLLPLIAWLGVLAFYRVEGKSAYLKQLLSRWLYLPFLALSTALYLGQDFFSPGWLLVVGYFCVLAVALVPLPKHLAPSSLWVFSIVLLFISSIPLVVRLQSLGWWEWHATQKEVYHQLQKAPPDTSELIVRSCENPQYPSVTFERVVANSEGLRQMWYLLHGKKIHAGIVPCAYPTSAVPKSGAWFVEWRLGSPLRFPLLVE